MRLLRSGMRSLMNDFGIRAHYCIGFFATRREPVPGGSAPMCRTSASLRATSPQGRVHGVSSTGLTVTRCELRSTNYETRNTVEQVDNGFNVYR